MEGQERTTRQQIADHLRESPATPRALAAEFDITAALAVDHVTHLARSLPAGAVVAAPPRCRDCGFEDFDDLANRPSRCPDCKSESIEDPTFAIEE